MANQPEHFEVVTSAPNELEAGIIVAALEREGIKSSTSGEATAGFRVGVPGEVQILVAEADLPRALQVLADAEAAGDAADEEESGADYDESDEFDDEGDELDDEGE